MGQSGLACQPKMGLREQNKADKLRRIKAAARKLFLRKGYEATTTREIAELAGVSAGTVFIYARDKGDLVCLMAIDRLESEFARAFKSCDAGQPLLEQMLSVCEYMFRKTVKNVALSRILIKEIMSHRDRERILDWVVAQYERLLVTALECGEVAFDGEDPAFVARTIHAMYLAEIRHWIMTDNPQPSEAVKNLRRSFRLLLRGINYKPTPKHAIAGLSPHSQASSITSTLCTTCTEMGAS